MAFRAGYVSDQQIRMRLCRVAYKNYPVKKLEQQGLQFSKTILPNLLHDHAKQRIVWHQQQGIDLICNQLEVWAGRYTGELQQGDCGDAEKANRIQQKYKLSDFDAIYAYGDSPNDHAMLALADYKFYQWQAI